MTTLNDLIKCLKRNSFESNTEMLPFLNENDDVFDHIYEIIEDTEVLLPLPITTPIIHRKPMYNHDMSIVNIWKTLTIGTNDYTKYDVIVSLVPWSEMNAYDIQEYPQTVQAHKKIFLHFPFQKPPKIPDRSLLLNIRAITSVINTYLDDNKHVLLHGHKDKQRPLFLALCCMLNSGIIYDEVQNIAGILQLHKYYHLYLRQFYNLVQEIR